MACLHLYGSTTSPFVRRVRILLAEHPYQFHPVSVFSEEDRQEILRQNPVGKVPYLVDTQAQQTIWDSLIITKYLRTKFHMNSSFTLEEEKKLALLNEANDAGILLYQFRKFKLDESWRHSLSQNLYERIQRIVAFFATQSPEGTELQDPVSNWLYCFLDWATFREVYTLSSREHTLEKFMTTYAQYPVVQATNPRLS